MNSHELFLLWRQLRQDLAAPEMWWQVAALLAALGLAWLLARQVHDRLADDDRLGASLRFGQYGLRRVAYPLLALALVFCARAALKGLSDGGSSSLLDIAVPLLGSLAAVRAAVAMLRYAFPRATWIAASERAIATLVWGSLALYITGLSTPVIDLLRSVSFEIGKDSVDLWMVLRGLLVLGVVVLSALWLAGLIERRLLAAQGLDSSLRVVLGRLAKAILTLLAVLFSLTLIGIDITALSVFGGAIGVGLGFGLQKIASNYFSGFIILLDRSIRLGNVITLESGTSGVVTQITTRYTVVRALSGTESIVPNELLVSNIVLNQSYTDTRVRLATSVGIAYRSDVDAVMALLVEIARSHPRVLADPPPKVLLTAFADSSINLELGFWIDDPEEGTGNIRSEINLAIWRGFREHGVEIPFPQREVRVLGEPAAPPFPAGE